MGRLATGFLVAAVLGLGVAAAIDGLRGRSEGGPPAALAGAASVSERGRAAATLRQAGVAGTLTYSDADCRPRALHLPSLRPASASPIESCEPYSEAGRLGVPEGAVVSKRLNQRLSERGWDGGFRTVQAVRLGGEAFAVLAESTYEPRERLVAGFDGSRLRFLLPRWRIGNPRLLRASPRGGYVALLDRVSVRIFTGAGRELSLPPLPARGRLVARRALDGDRDQRECLRSLDEAATEAAPSDPGPGPRPRLGSRVARRRAGEFAPRRPRPVPRVRT